MGRFSAAQQVTLFKPTAIPRLLDPLHFGPPSPRIPTKRPTSPRRIHVSVYHWLARHYRQITSNAKTKLYIKWADLPLFHKTENR